MESRSSSGLLDRKAEERLKSRVKTMRLTTQVGLGIGPAEARVRRLVDRFPALKPYLHRHAIPGYPEALRSLSLSRDLCWDSLSRVEAFHLHGLQGELVATFKLLDLGYPSLEVGWIETGGESGARRPVLARYLTYELADERPTQLSLAAIFIGPTPTEVIYNEVGRAYQVAYPDEFRLLDDYERTCTGLRLMKDAEGSLALGLSGQHPHLPTVLGESLKTALSPEELTLAGRAPFFHDPFSVTLPFQLTDEGESF